MINRITPDYIKILAHTLASKILAQNEIKIGRFKNFS